MPEVLTAVLMKIRVAWGVKACNLINGYKVFEGSQCLSGSSTVDLGYLILASQEIRILSRFTALL
jgi:hypothetical protein